MRKTKKKKNKNHLRKARIKYYSIKKGGLLGDKGNNYKDHIYPKKSQQNEVDIAERSFKSTKSMYGNAAEANTMAAAAKARAASNARAAERSAAWVDAWEDARDAMIKRDNADKAAKALPKAVSEVTHIFPSYTDAYLDKYNPEYGVSLPIPMLHSEFLNDHMRRVR